MTGDNDGPIGEFGCLVFREGAPTREARRVVAEEPLTILLGTRPLVTLMRMPGNERELALGYLITEGLVGSAKDVGMIAFCESGEEEWGGQLRVELAEGVELRREPGAHRAVFSSCSLCGAEVIEDVAQSIAPFPGSEMDPAGICGIGKRLRAEQPVFEATGGTHGAALVLCPPFVRGGGQPDEPVIIVREDIGRHNALDKVVGAAAMQGLRDGQSLLFLSGRLSFEMVAKAARAGIGAVAGVSAPTALSVQLARRLNMILAGFVRGDTFTLYAGRGVGEEEREQDVRGG